jgi:hypothetical protein
MKKGKKIKFTEEEWAELNNTPSYEEWKKLFNDIQGLFVKKDPTVTDLNTPTNVVEPQKPLGTKKTNVLINTTNEPINKTTNKIMTPKEKAEQLFNWFLNEGLHSYSRYQSSSIEDREGAKFCALKVADEKISKNIINTLVDYGASWTYWQQVKREIEKL